MKCGNQCPNCGAFNTINYDFTKRKGHKGIMFRCVECGFDRIYGEENSPRDKKQN